MAKKRKYYKVLRVNGLSTHAYTKWFLPKGDRPGKWMPKLTRPLKQCKHGYHAALAKSLGLWLCAGSPWECNVFELEYEGHVSVISYLWYKNSDKACGARARLIRKLSPEEVRQILDGNSA